MLMSKRIKPSKPTRRASIVSFQAKRQPGLPFCFMIHLYALLTG